MKGDFQIIAWLVETKLNGIKYLYAGQFIQLISIVQGAFNLDYKNTSNIEIAFNSVKSAIEIYFVPEDYLVGDVILSTKKDWWSNLTYGDMDIVWNPPSQWHKIGWYSYGWKEQVNFEEKILFHINTRLQVEN